MLNTIRYMELASMNSPRVRMKHDRPNMSREIHFVASQNSLTCWITGRIENGGVNRDIPCPAFRRRYEYPKCRQVLGRLYHLSDF